MRIQFASDLHLEFADNWRYLKQHPLDKTGDVLVLAGDIGYLGDDNYSKHPFWDIVSEQYEQVLVVPGNHEFYKFYDIATLRDGDYGKEFRDTYGIPVYQEQTSDPSLAPKGHFIGRTMMAVEALWPYRNKTKLR